MDKKSCISYKWTIGYIAINVLYFCVFCSVHGFAAVILLDRGFSNALIGVTLAVANVLSALGQPLIAGVVDRSSRLTNRRVIIGSSAVLIAAVAALMFIRTGTAVIFALFAFIYALQFVYQSNMIAMNFEYQRAGCSINFGLARGLGSAGFAVSSAVLGGFVERDGTDVLMVFTMVALGLLIVVTYLYKKPESAAVGEEKPESAAVGTEAPERTGAGSRAGAHKADRAGGSGDGSFTAFFRKYRRFMLFILGTTLCFFSHNMLNDYLIQIVRSLGGGETQLGYATFLSAILELPVMALIGLVLKRIRANRVLVFSGVAFVVKNVIMLLATDMTGMYLSQACQLFAYAVFIPTAAYYADAVMEDCDKVKGQAFINSAITLGGVFSSLICGRILDDAGVGAMLATGVGVCVAGMFTIWISVRGRKNEQA